MLVMPCWSVPSRRDELVMLGEMSLDQKSFFRRLDVGVPWLIDGVKGAGLKGFLYQFLLDETPNGNCFYGSG